MRGPIAVALVVVGVALPACAQRGGGGRGGAVGHSSGFASRGGGSFGSGGRLASSSDGFASPSSGFVSQSVPAFHADFAPEIHSNPGPSTQFRNSQYGGRYRMPGTPIRMGIGHRPPYRYERSPLPYATGLSYAGWINPDCFSFGDCGPYDNASYSGPPAPDVNSDAYAQGAPAYATQDAAEQEADTAQPAFRPAYQRPVPPPEPEEPVTLVFKDGRAPEQIHNYMLTRTTLYVQDEHRREIAVGDLDLAATEKANKDAGASFQLPGAPQSGL